MAASDMMDPTYYVKFGNEADDIELSWLMSWAEFVQSLVPMQDPASASFVLVDPKDASTVARVDSHQYSAFQNWGRDRKARYVHVRGGQ